MYEVLLEGLECYAHHGATDAEQSTGHRYRIDLAVRVDGGAAQSDNLTETVDYGRLAEFVLQRMAASRHRTVEHLAKTVCQDVLQEFSLAQRVSLTLVKPLPPAPVIAAAAGVKMVVDRNGA